MDTQLNRGNKLSPLIILIVHVWDLLFLNVVKVIDLEKFGIWQLNEKD